jgi:hypothetical protein
MDGGALGCKAQFETGFFHFVTRIRDRRFAVVDEERGLVLARHPAVPADGLGVVL